MFVKVLAEDFEDTMPTFIDSEEEEEESVTDKSYNYHNNFE